ncbi:hypothetical protein ACWCXB_04695 [Streptomyces sp. NPDC001514]
MHHGPGAIHRLRGLGLTPILLTGDDKAVAAAVAAEVESIVSMPL